MNGRGSEFQAYRLNAANVSVGQVSSEPLTWTVTAKNSVSSTSEEIAAAGTGAGRTVLIKVPTSATTGICINFGAAATTSSYLIEPGEARSFATEQQVQAIRAGASDVDVYVVIGKA